MTKFTDATGTQKGFSLLEILIAIMIFAIGMLALFQLQGGLSRSASDANLRTMAINIAEEAIETRRGFSRINTDPDGILYAYEDIVPYTATVSRGDMNFDFDVIVADYWYHKDTELFSTTEPLEAAHSAFKMMTVNVTWNDSQEFTIDETQSTSGRLGSGKIVLTEMISSVTSAADAKTATGGTGGMYFPTINYNPGSRPDIISISLGQNKFKESTTPLPDVLRLDELVETRFDVVTYSQDDAGATFLRREEFLAVSCQCLLHTPSGSNGGWRPTLWIGEEYSEAEWVTKAYGQGTSNQQSLFCDICCRDHHDGGTGAKDDANDPGRALYDPFRDAADFWTSGALVGDHKHYDRDSNGDLILAVGDGDNYVEACRLVRKDGFMKAAHDLRQEGLNSFPANYLDETDEVAIYSAYVTESVVDFEAAIGNTNLYELNPPSLTAPGDMAPPVTFPASVSNLATTLPTVTGMTSQQLRSRGIYVDYMSDELRTIINCLDDGGTGIDCEVPSVTTSLEIIPFYDVQVTWLSRWNETPVNNPVDVSNEALESNNTHSRGLATLESGTDISTVNAAVHKSNLGLTGTDPIDPNYTSEEKNYDMYVLAVDGTPAPELGTVVVVGDITSAVGGVSASDVEISFSGAQCDRTNTGYGCVIETGAVNPTLTISNYDKSGTNLLGCSAVLTTDGQQVGTPNWTRFNLPFTTISDGHIVIKKNNC